MHSEQVSEKKKESMEYFIVEKKETFYFILCTHI